MSMENSRARSGPAVEIRPAAPADLAAINDIYNHYVRTSTCTYQEQPVSLADRQAWLGEHPIDRFPATSALLDGELVGFASIAPFRERVGYRFTVENSVYVRYDLHRRGIGGRLLEDLIERSRGLGYQTIIGAIDAEQQGSIELHDRFGFESKGRLVRAGFKFGRWLDVIFMQRML
jgi:phosphinothricin acetyltransferase